MSQRTTSGSTATEAGSVPSPAPEPDGPPSDEAPVAAVVPAPHAHFAGPLRPLDRLATVRPGTLAVILDRGEPVRQKLSGEVVVPDWIPLRSRVQVLVVATDTVTVPVTVHGLSTLDSEYLHQVDLAVEVRLRESTVLGLVGEFGADLDARLLREIRRVVESSVRAAVGMNRAFDVRRQSMTELLNDRWLPPTFVSGAVVLEGFRQTGLRWTAEDPPPDVRTGQDPVPKDRHEPAGDGQALDGGRDRSLTLAPLRIRGHAGAEQSASSALKYVHVPLVISVSAFWLFFSVYWVPELQTFPGSGWLLDQLSPLASKELTSRSEALATSQVDRLGLPAAFLLVASLLIPPLARSRWWLTRLSLWPLTYLAGVCVAVALMSALVRGRIGAELLGVVLLLVWLAAAGVTTWRSLWVDVETLPLRPAQVLWVVAVVALLNPVPVAVGRSVFAPELREAAGVVVHNDLSLRWAALLTPTTALVYGCGLLLAVLVWALYLLWPPRRVEKVTIPLTALVLVVVGLAVLGPATGAAAIARAQVIRTGSPTADIGFTCGSWTRRDAALPTQTLVVTGLTCRRVTAFRGYEELSSRDDDLSLSPVKAETLDGERIRGKLISAQYGGVVVLAASGRFDNRATQLVGVRISDASTAWRHSCAEDDDLRLRFAHSTDGDDFSSARRTFRGEPPTVLVDCGHGTLRLDPATGRRL